MRRQILKQFFGTSLLSRVLLLASSSVLAHIVTIFSLPIISRMFSPEQLGMVGLITAVITFMVPIICLRFDGALPLANRTADAGRLVWICLATAIVMGAICYGAFRVLQVNALLGFGVLPGWSHWIVLACLPGTAFFAIGQAWWLRQGRTSIIGGNLILRSLVQNGVRITLGALGLGLLGLAAAEIAMATTAFYMASQMPWRRIKTTMGSGFVHIWKLVRDWRRFPLIEGPSSILDSFVIIFLPIPLITALYGSEVAGLFAMALRIGSIPIAQIGKAIGNATYMDFSNAARRGDYNSMAQLFYRVIRRLLMFGLIPMIAFAALAPFLIGSILGADWADSGIYLALMTPWLYAQIVVVPMSRIISVLQRQDLKLLVDIVFLIATVAVYFIADALGLDDKMYIALLSISMCCSYIVYFLVLNYAIKRIIAN